MCTKSLVCLGTLSAILMGPALVATSEEVWTATPVRPVEEFHFGPSATLPRFPAHSIESQLQMVIRAKMDGHWVDVGETPGTVDVPACEDLELYLGWLRESSCDQYVKEVQRLGIRRLELRSDTDFLDRFRESGLLDHVTALTVRGYDYSIRDLSDLVGLTELTELDLTPSCDLKDISALAEMPQLTALGIGGCPRLESLEPIATLKNLRHLHLPDFTDEQQIAWLIDQGVLQRLDSLTMCDPRPAALAALPQLNQLRSFCLRRSTVKDLSFFIKMPNLQSLYLNAGASDFAPVLELTKLRSLQLISCDSMTTLPELKRLEHLESLAISQNQGLRDITPLAGLQHVRWLDLSWNMFLPQLTGLEDFRRLRSLSLRGCHQLTDISALSGLTELQSLDLFRCRDLVDVSPVRELTKLRVLDLDFCPQVEDLTPLYGLSQLTDLSLVTRTMTDEKLREFQQQGVLRNLRTLHLTCDNLQDVAVTDMPRITKLKLSQCQLRSLTLANVPELNQISLGYPHEIQSLSLDDSPKQRDLLLKQLPRELTGR